MRLSRKGWNSLPEETSVTGANTAKLLVSVRNAAEAQAALRGGCDVLDVKEPDRGAMGMADIATIVEVVTHCRSGVSRVPVSVALGEVAEWTPGRQVPSLPEKIARGIAYLKLGTAGLASNSGWAASFGALVRRFETESNQTNVAAVSGTTDAVAGGFAPSWIAVAYADWQIAHAPPPSAVIAAAAECGCTGVLIDTFSKGRLRLLDWLDGSRLVALAEQARSLGLTFALAGRLQIGHLPQVLAAGPDIVGIRSAACRDGIRNGAIDPAAVRAFREALRAV
jgi:uncharacterized protein (UPF0264 family)